MARSRYGCAARSTRTRNRAGSSTRSSAPRRRARTFQAVDEFLRQRLRAGLRAAIDVRPGPADAATLAREAWRPFDLATGPLLRAVLWRVADDDHVLLLVIHHIVGDGWSEQVLLRDLSACYLAARENRPPRLAPIAVQPADFAVWEAQQIASGELDAALARVRTRLARRGPGQALRRGRTAAGMSGPAATLRTPLDPELTSPREVARGGAATEFTLLLTALAGASGPAHRPARSGGGHARLRPPPARPGRPAGCFVNMVPLRLRWAAAETTAGVFAVVRDALADGLADQQVPLNMVVAAVEDGRSANGTPLMDLLFSVEEHPPVADMLDGVRAAMIPLEAVATKADLHCVAERDAGGLALRWNTAATPWMAPMCGPSPRRSRSCCVICWPSPACGRPGPPAIRRRRRPGRARSSRAAQHRVAPHRAPQRAVGLAEHRTARWRCRWPRCGPRCSTRTSSGSAARRLLRHRRPQSAGRPGRRAPERAARRAGRPQGRAGVSDRGRPGRGGQPGRATPHRTHTAAARLGHHGPAFVPAAAGLPAFVAGTRLRRLQHPAGRHGPGQTRGPGHARRAALRGGQA